MEHIDRNKFQKIYGIDINEEYLKAVKERYTNISDILECIQLNLVEDTDKLPKAELLVANLLIEYIGYDCFQNAVEQVQPNLLIQTLNDIKYKLIAQKENPLPNGKKLVQLDFEH